MEHKLISGGEQYLPFARSRIKALRAAGLEYASQQFEIGGSSVKVRIEPGHEYISLSGGQFVWVLIAVEERYTPHASGLYFGDSNIAVSQHPDSMTRTLTRESMLLRFDPDLKKAKLYHSGEGVVNASITSSAGTVTSATADFSPYLNTVAGFAPLGAEAILLKLADNLKAPVFTTLNPSSGFPVFNRSMHSRLTYGDANHDFVGGVDEGVPFGEYVPWAPVSFKSGSAEFSVFSLSGFPANVEEAVFGPGASPNWAQKKVSSSGVVSSDSTRRVTPYGAVAYPATEIDWQWGIYKFPPLPPAPSYREAAYSKREVSWHKQGTGFIHHYTGFVSDRSNSPASFHPPCTASSDRNFLAGEPTAENLASVLTSAGKCLRWPSSVDTLTPMRNIELWRTDAADKYGVVDLLDVPEVAASARISQALEYTGWLTTVAVSARERGFPNTDYCSTVIGLGNQIIKPPANQRTMHVFNNTFEGIYSTDVNTEFTLTIRVLPS